MDTIIAVFLSLFSPMFSYSQFDIGVEAKKGIEEQLMSLYGQYAPNFSLLNNSGKRIRLDEYKDKVVVLDFWGTYCAPCIRDIPEFNEVQSFYTDSNNIVFISICIDKIENETHWRDLIYQHKMNGIHLFLPKNTALIGENKYYLDSINSLPTYLLVSKNGLILGELPNVDSKIMPYTIDRGLENNSTTQSFEEAISSSDTFNKWMDKHIEYFK
jgi:thiol-disulfide isomerase/thioredoxin